tara:strand:+ start:1271 stop:2110 length:840 start_codon:yes stop_codon:yes gene_type:complete
MKRFDKIKILASFVSFAIIGCSFYVETAKVRGMYDDAQRDVSEKIAGIKDDYAQRNKMIQSITSQIPDKQITPYPTLNDKLDKMSKSIIDLEGSQSRMLSLRERFDQLSEGRKRFESDQPEWTRHKRVQDGYEKIMNGMRSMMNDYSMSSKSFNDIAGKYLRKVNVKAVRSDINQFLSNFDSEIGDFELGLEMQRSNNANSNQSRKSAFQEIDEILEKMRNKRNMLEAMLDTFNLEVGDKKEFMTGPGLKTYTITNDLVEISKGFSSHVDQLKKLTKEL